MYQVALFIHIGGVMCLMGGHTLLHVGLGRMRRAQTVEQVREWTTILAGLDRLMPPMTLAILLAGLYMAFTTWGWTTAWIDVSLTVFVVGVALFAGLLSTLRMRHAPLRVDLSPSTQGK